MGSDPATIAANFRANIYRYFYKRFSASNDLTDAELSILCGLEHDPSVPYVTAGQMTALDAVIQGYIPAQWARWQKGCAHGLYLVQLMTPTEKAAAMVTLEYRIGVNGHVARLKLDGGEVLLWAAAAELAWKWGSQLGDYLSSTFSETYYQIGAAEWALINASPQMEPLPGDVTMAWDFPAGPDGAAFLILGQPGKK